MQRSDRLRGLVITVGLMGFATEAPAQQRVDTAGAQRPPALLQDYIMFSVTAPPPELELDPFYRKYTDAHGIPIVSSEKLPDAALLMARDIVQFMLANRPDLRKELIRKRWKVAIMAETEVTYDIPEHRKYRVLPKIDDERLTDEQRANYYKPGGVGTMTGEEYWNARGRGFGGEPDGENTTSCAEENLLGYPGTRYFGSSICVHEFSHGIMRGAIYTVDPEYRGAVEDAYRAAKDQGLPSAQGYPGNNFNEYWATGVEAWVFGSGRDRQGLLDADPRLYELVRQVIPDSKMPGNVYVGRRRQPRSQGQGG
ncbi:MAG: glycoside hydrolase [Gemmatimonadetes bacterium]|nr:glycoside hydrolase [Gemmatimonadota bacterium]